MEDVEGAADGGAEEPPDADRGDHPRHSIVTPARAARGQPLILLCSRSRVPGAGRC